ALDPGGGDEIVHPVETAENGRLAAAGGADQGGDLVAGEVERDLLHRLEVAVVDVDVAHAHRRRGGGDGALGGGARPHLGPQVSGRGGIHAAGPRTGLGVGSHDHAFLAYRLRSITAKAFNSNSSRSSARLAAAAMLRNSAWGYEVHWKIWMGRAV